MAIVDFYTKEDQWSIEHVLAVIVDLVEECTDDEEMKDVDSGLTVYEAKLLLEKIKELSP